MPANRSEASAPPDPAPRPIDRVVIPLRGLGAQRSTAALVLLGATALALACASSPLRHTYHAALQMHVTLSMGDALLEKSLLHWINDGLMTLFFFVVGLEIKRELLAGELASARKAALPAVAALGGMVLPAALYASVNWNRPTLDGWGIPMATDIPFALGILAVGLRAGAPTSLKVFLTALAIVDDIGAVLVIALFYTARVGVGSLVVGAVLLGVALACNRLGVRSPLVYAFIGSLVWLAFLNSGVHATLAALLMAFTIPARTRFAGRPLSEKLEHDLDRLQGLLPEDHGLNREEEQQVLDSMEVTLRQASAPLQRLELNLEPIVAFFVLPTFALANAGLDLGALSFRALSNPVTLGILLGLVVGKPLGILGASWLAARVGLAELPRGANYHHLAAVGTLSGIGFTMSLFITGLAFPGAEAREAARLGVLSASVLAGCLGVLWLRHAGSRVDRA